MVAVKLERELVLEAELCVRYSWGGRSEVKKMGVELFACRVWKIILARARSDFDIREG